MHNVQVVAELDRQIQRCDIPKKDLEDSPESGSNKGPDIIPLSIDPD
ncbi:hypothetical protein TNCT_559041, partial [Trichonephila clavata]